MKKALIGLVALFSIACGPNDNEGLIHEKLETELIEKYPDSFGFEFKKITGNKIEVQFEREGRHYTSSFKGNLLNKYSWQHTTIEISQTILPEEVTDAMFFLYPNATVIKVLKRESRHGGIDYLLSLYDQDNNYRIAISETGKVKNTNF